MEMLKLQKYVSPEIFSTITFTLLLRKFNKINDLLWSINSLKIASINPILPLLILILSPSLRFSICLVKISWELQFFFMHFNISSDKMHGFSPNFNTFFIPKVLWILVQLIPCFTLTNIYPGNNGFKIWFFLLNAKFNL